MILINNLVASFYVLLLIVKIFIQEVSLQEINISVEKENGLSYFNNNDEIRIEKELDINYNEIIYNDYEDDNEDVLKNENENNLIYTSKKIPIKFWEDNKKEEFQGHIKQNITQTDDETNYITIASTNFNFYDQLNSNEKNLYDILLKSSIKEVPKLNIKVLVKGVTDLEKYIAEITISAEKLFTVLVYEHPELWWIGNYQIVIYETKDQNSYTLNFSTIPDNSIFKNYTSDEISKLNAEIDIIKNEIINQIDNMKLTTQYSIIRYIHDYLIIMIEYLLDEDRQQIRTLYGALVENKCVCEGYAEAFQYLVQQYGINCIIARSLTHEWNFVELNNKWYILDVTYDDPIQDGKVLPTGSSSNIKTDYFLIGTNHVFKSKAKYTDDVDHILIYSAYSDKEMVYYPTIEKKDYVPTKLELQELDLINYSNITIGN
ncbi:hypothetical protein PIROE2DRAFT_7252 [Piromyces sp. E2]|nr:hypothetical protein PIROE2DRAFT_7252 [Piromyces sp. E2]|eukprot:OUM65670.1 hypothetical protein PIROE2DRAFT_7252 [Piromyces sp. E2]